MVTLHEVCYTWWVVVDELMGHKAMIHTSQDSRYAIHLTFD
jgi:hypothetical protein